MPEKILMIALSPTMETGTLARWRKKEGDAVASGDVLCEVETDKATMDYESSAEGTLLKILLPEGGQAKVGDVIAMVGKPGEDISGILAERQPPPLRPPPPLQRRSGSGGRGRCRACGAARGRPKSPAAAGRIKSSPLARKTRGPERRRHSLAARLRTRGQDREARH